VKGGICNSCKRSVVFARTERGKLMPIDPRPAEDGNLEIIALVEDVPTVRVLRKGDPTLAKRYMPHFATCPNAVRHRKPRVPKRELERQRHAADEIARYRAAMRGEL
jgi:hypothetical protein